MRIGILGGTFDPPHVGHLLAASDAAEALALDRLLFVPVAEQPLKTGAMVASAAHRFAMVGLLIGSDPRFVADPIEIERGGLSFTVETLRVLRERWRDDQALALFLLLGEDVVATLSMWREPNAVRALAEIVWLTRAPGPDAPPPAGRVLATRRVEVSSTEIRERVRAGRPIRGFVPEVVAEYIARHGLYR
ncbi:MAG TPA: nicotinate-nucleotide adenylyltransferase [Gemmatimonadaceae bacterium]|nr:nicotinate-nucleotide adenylyltransferase [Gemmatimonadaceae bacterium]